MKRGLLVCFMFLAVFAMVGTSYTQDAAAPAAEAESEYSYGTVVSVNKDANELVISEYDWSNDTETNVTFAMDPKVEVENAASWAEIPAGSEVDIEYIMENNKRVAKSISVYTSEDVSMEETQVPQEPAPVQAAPAAEAQAPVEAAAPAATEEAPVQ